MIYSIRYPELFEIHDDIGHAVRYGFDQEWYRTPWQRCSGCGPTAVANIVYYRSRTRGGTVPDGRPPLRSDCLAIMEEVWEYVKPTIHGIPSSALLADDVRAYAKAKGPDIRPETLDIPASRPERPEFPRLLSFLGTALSRDTPAAFLNLNNGGEKQLDSWHWVTIIRLETEPDGKASAAILDGGRIKTIDLAQWYETTTLGGGFVRFTYGG